MDEQTEKRDALSLLSGLENGALSTADAYAASQNIDPVLACILVRYLRACYPASDPAATSVLERVVSLTSTYRAFTEQCKKGEDDPITRWFEQEHVYRDYRGRGEDLIAIIVDKLYS